MKQDTEKSINDDTYTVSVECRNCGARQLYMAIKCGTTVEDSKCTICGCKTLVKLTNILW